MAKRKERLPVVFDTSLIITRFIRHERHGVNRRVIDLWQTSRQLQLIVSPPIVAEYLYALEHYAKISVVRVRFFGQRLELNSNVTRINLGTRFLLSRDPKDNIFLETAHTGKAKFLITRDRDLLEIPKEELKGFRFEIVTPFEFLRKIGEI